MISRARIIQNEILVLGNMEMVYYAIGINVNDNHLEMTFSHRLKTYGFHYIN